MNVQHECIPCLIRQAYEAALLVTGDASVQEDILRFALKELGESTFEETSPHLAMRLHQHVKKVTGNPDPYRPYKEKFNRIAQSLIDDGRLQEKIAGSDDPFDLACRLALAGNIIDFGLGLTVDQALLETSLSQSLTAPLHGLDTQTLWQRCQDAQSILILGDNAGEIVFDKLLVAQLPRSKVTYAVKGGPIVNDATMQDAKAVGMDQLATVISNGLEAQGTMLAGVSEDFRQVYQRSELILAKGQANYETLHEGNDPRLVFLLQAKCASIARVIGCKQGDFVLTAGA